MTIGVAGASRISCSAAGLILTSRHTPHSLLQLLPEDGHLGLYREGQLEHDSGDMYNLGLGEALSQLWDRIIDRHVTQNKERLHLECHNAVDKMNARRRGVDSVFQGVVAKTSACLPPGLRESSILRPVVLLEGQRALASTRDLRSTLEQETACSSTRIRNERQRSTEKSTRK